jgi:hypothetical protein
MGPGCITIASGFALARCDGRARSASSIRARGEQHLAQPFALDAQHHHDVRPFDGGREVVEHRDAQLLDPVGNHRARPAHAHLGPEPGQQVDVRSRDARVRNVSGDRDDQVADRALRAANRERVEQGLRRVLVRPVPSVDHARGGVLRDEVRRAARRVADHQHVWAHGLEVLHGVEQRLALAHARARRGNVDHVSAQAFSSDFEGRAGASARLEEEVDDRLAAKGRDLSDLSARDVEEDLCGVEVLHDVARVPRSSMSRQVPVRGRSSRAEDRRSGRAREALLRGTITRSAPSSASSSTSTRSSRRVSTTRPT